ncbi:SPFH domain-containing protein [Microtetraspora sp. AC03309]|uniref:SPFH domain-containing protein n=1 Tax=Microtetraspora sp. AC03309 TaxID=2779376 RepID=UPI001E34E4C1|nr:SPFH domain-containing protein [Microtetraspora sp. AC03309]MCC5580817.1 SPFH domain-containing protein [Microtetraspora sp. AC03309]
MPRSAPRADDRRSGSFRKWAIVTVILAIILAVPTVIGAFGGFERTGGGEVAVIRNGGLLDDNRVRQIIDPGSSVTWIGWWSQIHRYPAQQRYYTITSTEGGERSGVDVVTVPSSDGVNMGIEGTLYFNLNLDHETLRSFDDKFGTRKFRSVDGGTYYPWDSDEGWSAFLDQIIRPVIDNDLRTQVNSFRCAELVSSCSLVQNSGGQQTGLQQLGNNANIAKIQNAVNTSLAEDLKSTLGAEYLTNIHFNLSRVTLPKQVQDAVDQAQAAFAKVTEAQAKVAQARAEADANKARQDGYNRCPTCAEIEKLKALPQGITVYAPGNTGGVALPTR